MKSKKEKLEERFAALYSENNVNNIKSLQVGNKWVFKIELPYETFTFTYERLSEEEAKKCFETNFTLQNTQGNIVSTKCPVCGGLIKMFKDGMTGKSDFYFMVCNKCNLQILEDKYEAMN